MTGSTETLGFVTEVFESFLPVARSPNGWRRDAAMRGGRSRNASWPRRNEEEWMRTDIRLFHLDRFSLPLDAPPAQQPPSDLLREGVELAGASVTINSHAASSHLDPQWSDKGVIFGSLEDMLNEHAELLRPYMTSDLVDPRHDRFAMLHAACWSGGRVLYVPRGVAVAQPLHALSVISGESVDFGKTLVILEDGAEATLLTETASTDDEAPGLHCGSVELFLAPGANLRFVNLQDWNQRTWHFAHQGARVQRDASLQWTVASIGGRLSKVNQFVQLAGPGANSQVNGVLFTQNKQHIDYHTLQHHQAPACRSDFLYKSALQDQSRTVWRGMIKVDPAAQKTDGYQRNDNLLLSGQARADSIPGLEIEADDVRCTHGSTSGRVDEELIFYAQARGYTRREAIRIVVSGFFQQIFDRITIPSVREALGDVIARRVREYQ